MPVSPVVEVLHCSSTLSPPRQPLVETHSGFPKLVEQFDVASGQVVRDCAGNALFRGDEAARWETDPCLPEVPAELLVAERWRTVLADRWVWVHDILRLEARGVGKAVARVHAI